MFFKNLNEKIKQNKRQKKALKNIAILADNLNHKFNVYYNKTQNDVLSDLCDKYGSDKGSLKKSGHPYTWAPHTYTDFYNGLFSHCRGHITKVFECGLGTNNPHIIANMSVNGKPGASHRVWRDYFPNAQIIGADIDRAVLFAEERIKTFYVDQLNPADISAMWQNVNVTGFNLMVDDGLHKFEAGKCLFENSIQHLADDGIYIIEDVWTIDLVKYMQFFSTKSLHVKYITLYRDNKISDNNLIVIRK